MQVLHNAGICMLRVKWKPQEVRGFGTQLFFWICELKGWGRESFSETSWSLSRPDILGPEFLPVKPMRCVLTFWFGVAFATSFSPQSHPWHQPPCEGCWSQSTALGPKFCTSHVGLWVLVFKVLEWREEEDGALVPFSRIIDSFYSRAAVQQLQPSVDFAPLLWPCKITNTCVLCRHQSCKQWFMCSVEHQCTWAMYKDLEKSGQKPVIPSCFECDPESAHRPHSRTQTCSGKHKAGSWAARCTALWFLSFLYI